MGFLVALLAFAGVMAFLSTLVSVFIEALHKVFALRRSGLEEMLRAMHHNVLRQLDPAAASSTLDTSRFVTSPSDREASAFARRMTENVAFSGHGRFWWLRNIPGLNWFFRKRHESLSTLQFVEQLARSDIGRSLRGLTRDMRQRALTAAAYEFERFGDAQSAYFQSRARILSVFAALIFAFAANIDALQIYRVLSRNEEIRGLVIANTSANIDEYERAYNAAAAPAETAPPAADAAGQASADVAQQRTAAQQQANANLRASGESAVQGVGELQRFGLPIGYAAFPFCYQPDVTRLDPRCDEPAERVSVLGAAERFWYSRDGWLWLLSVLLAGGLIGLGAPFWYQVFRRLARVVPGAQSVRAVVQSEVPPPTAGQRRTAVRDAGSASPDALLLAFDVASGNVAQSIVDPNVQTALDARDGGGGSPPAQAPVTRVVHGDGSVTTLHGVTRHLR